MIITSAILDTIFTYNALPLITKATRIIKITTTLIGHILTQIIDIGPGYL